MTSHSLLTEGRPTLNKMSPNRAFANMKNTSSESVLRQTACSRAYLILLQKGKSCVKAKLLRKFKKK